MHAVIYVYEDFTPMEVFGFHNLLSRSPNMRTTLVSETKGVVYSSDKQISINITTSIDEITDADVLFIPGSIVGWTQEIRKKRVLHWIRQMDAITKYTTSACTGSIILAASGLLENKNATAFWRIGHLMTDYGVHYISDPIVRDGKYFTAEGASSTMELAMQIGRLLNGERNMQITQLLLAYESPKSPSVAELRKDDDLVKTTNKIIFEEGRNTLSIFQKIMNARLMLRLLKED